MQTQAACVPEASPARRQWASRANGLVLLCVLVVLTFYVRAAWSYEKSLNPQPSPIPVASNYENHIADSLLARQLNLKIEPPEGLLRLHDPYDPLANAQYRSQGLHDLSLYKGKLYAYFGPAPAILLYIPFRVLRVGALSPTLAVLVFGALGFLFSLALFRLLVRWCYESIPVWMHCVAVFTLGLGVPVAWMIYVGRDYEATIACGYMLLFAGLYFLARGILIQSRPLLVLIGSGLLGLAVASRPTMVVGGIFVLAALVFVQRSGLNRKRRNTFLLALIAPYIVIGVLLALYNLARFDSIFEFGQSYQLAGENIRTYPFRQLSYIPKGLYSYLVSPGRILGNYPYLFLRKNTLNVGLLQHGLARNDYTSEPVAGALTNMPAAIMGYLLVATGARRVARMNSRILPVLLLLSVPALIVVVVVSYQLRGTSMRYELEFAPLIMIGGTLAWVAWA
jgi:hypothetical protein